MRFSLVSAVIASVAAVAAAGFDDSLGAHAGFQIQRALPGAATFKCESS